MANRLPDLYHFTCAHGHDGIDRTGTILPNAHPFMRHLGPLLWLTDLAEPPTPESVGLQSTWITCDRLAYRYSVQTRAAVPWSQVRTKASREIVATLESFGQPEHWWIVRRPLTLSEFSFDETWRRDKAEATS